MPVIIKLDGIDYPEQAPEVAKHIEKLDALIAKHPAEVAAVQTKLDAKTAELAGVQAKLDAANAEIAALPGKIAAAASARSELIASVKGILPEETKTDSMSDADIRKSVAALAFPTSADKINSVKNDNAEGIGVWFDAAMSTLTNRRTDSVAAANRAKANGDPAKGDQTVKLDAQAESEKAVFDLSKEHKKGNRDQLLGNK